MKRMRITRDLRALVVVVGSKPDTVTALVLRDRARVGRLGGS